MFTRKYFYEITSDGKSLIIGTNWDSETHQLNQIGIMTVCIGNPFLLDFNFKLDNGQVIDLKGATCDEIIDSVKDYFSKDDIIGLCPWLFTWR